MGYTHFLNNEIRISWKATRLTVVFFSCRTPTQFTRKASFEVCVESLRPSFKLGKETAFEPKLTCVYLLYRLCLAFISCIQAAFSTFRFAHVGAERQTNTQTYKHTQFSEKFFNKKCGHKCTIYANGIYLIQSYN